MCGGMNLITSRSKRSKAALHRVASRRVAAVEEEEEMQDALAKEKEEESERGRCHYNGRGIPCSCLS